MKPQLFSHVTIATIATMFLAAACGLNESGNVAATDGGDVSNPAERGSPVEAQRACGDGAPTEAGEVVLRRPYLQQVSADRAMLGWVSSAPAGERVEITTPRGDKVTDAPGVPEQTELRVPGGSQMWATITGLEPDTVYCYALAGDGGPRAAPTGFKTAPAPDSAAPVRFLAFGDSGGGGSDQRALRDRMYDYPYDFMIHTGDLAYDRGKLSEFEANVFRVYADLFQNLPFFPTPGNHEYESHGGAAYRDVFAIPGDGGEQFYSFDWGRVHFASIDTEQDYAKQIAWLDRDLAATKLPWKVVYLHKPPFSAGDHGSDTALQKLLAPVVEKHGVQLVLAGHDHHYERVTPQRGVAYFVTGGGGRGTRAVQPRDFTAFSDEVIHYLYIEVHEDRAIVHAVDATGVEFDSAVIPRERA